MAQAGLFPTLRDPWPPIVTPQFPQNPVVASSRDPNMEMRIMTFGLGGLAAGSGYRGAVGRMVPSPRAYEGPTMRGLAAARVLMASGQMHKLGRSGVSGLGDTCTDHTATDWARAISQGAAVFNQVAQTTHDAGWMQAGTVTNQIGTGVNTIASGMCTPTTTPAGLSQNDMQNRIANDMNQASLTQPPPVFTPSAPKTNYTPWIIGGGVAAAALIAAVLIFK